MYKSRSILPLGVIGLLLLAACQPGTGEQGASSSSSSEEEMMEASSGPFLEEGSSSSAEPVVIDLTSSAPAMHASSMPAVTSSTMPAASSKQAEVQTRVITINITNWSFSPSTISVKKGEKVQLKLVGGEGIHSFSAPSLGLNVRVEAGKTVVIDLPTGTTGTFDARCGIPCGSGHSSMKATIVVS